MGKVTLNPVLDGMRGSIGNLVFRRYGDQVTVGRKAQNDRPPTEAQTAHRERFKLAMLYGKRALSNPDTRAAYKDAANGRPLFSVAVSDFFNAPVVDEIDLSAYNGGAGEPIRILARDDFELKRSVFALRMAMAPSLKKDPPGSMKTVKAPGFIWQPPPFRMPKALQSK